MDALVQLSACVVIYTAFRTFGSSFAFGWFGGITAMLAMKIIERAMS